MTSHKVTTPASGITNSTRWGGISQCGVQHEPFIAARTHARTHAHARIFCYSANHVTVESFSRGRIRMSTKQHTAAGLLLYRVLLTRGTTANTKQ